MQFIGAASIAHAGVAALLKPAPVRLLHCARAEQDESALRKAGDGHVAIELSLRRQHGPKGDAAGLRHAPGQHVVEEIAGAAANEFMLCEIGDFDAVHRFPHGFQLARPIGMGPGTAEGGILMRVLEPEALIQ